MRHLKRCAFIMIVLLAALFVSYGSAFAVNKTLTIGSTAASSGTVSLPVTVGDATDVGGIAFTITYDPAIFTWAGLEQVTKVITDGSQAGGYTTNEYQNDMFYQVNDVQSSGNAIGRILIAAASANPLSGTNTVLFNARFTIKGGSGAYPIHLQQTIIQNAAAGYTTPEFIPVFVGASTFNSTTQKYETTTFPVYAHTFVDGAITVNAATFTIGGSVTYGAGGSPAAGSTVVLKRNTADAGYVFDAQTTVSASGTYSFGGKPAGTYQVFVTSNNPGYQNGQSNSFDLSANRTVDTIVLPAPQPLTGTLTGTAVALPGLQVKVMNGQTLVGIYPVNADGTFQTPPLAQGSYTMYFIYGSLTSASFTSGQTLNWSPTLYSIGGTISNASGPFTVMASSVTGKLQKTITAAGPAYSIGNLVPANDYIVSVTGAGLPVTYFDGKTDITQATALNILSDNQTGVDFDFGNITKGTIGGTITENANGVPNIGVYAFETTKFSLTQAAANGTGVYSFSLAPGNYEIFVIKANGKIFYYAVGGSTQSEAAATVLTLAAGGALAGKNIDISECTNTLSGAVTYKRVGGDPAANVLITAVSNLGKGIAMTGPNGSYSIGGLCGATYQVTMNPLNSKYAVQNATVAVAGTAAQNFIIDTGNVLSGKITDSSNSANVANAMIYLLDQQTGTLVNGRMYFSNSTGDYVIADIANGIYGLNATHPLYRSYGESNVIISADTTKNFQMVKGAYFDVTVTDGDNGNIPLAGALIIVTRAGDVPVYALTNNSGNAKIYGLDSAQSDYLILAQKPGFDRQSKTAQTPAVSGTAVSFSLTRPASLFGLSGTITSSCGGAIADAFVLVSSVNKNFFATAITNASGQYSFTNLPQANDYRFVVVPGGSLRVQVETGLNYTGNTTFTKDVILPCGSTITGNVTRNGTATIYVFLYTADNTFVAFTAADGSGNYTFNGLTNATTYKILAVSSGNTPKWYDGQTAIGSATAVAAGDSGKNITLTP